MTVGRRLAHSVLWWTMGLGLTNCVIRYGEQDVSAPSQAAQMAVRPVDFGPVERRLAVMVDQSVEVDSRDRLEAAWTLAQSMRDADPQAQHVVLAYLEAVLEVEKRAAPEGASVQTRTLGSGFGGAGVVDSEELAGPEPIAQVDIPREVNLLEPMVLEGEADGEGEAVAAAPEQGPNVNLLLADAVRHLEAKKPEKAMEVLEACRDLPCWDDVADSWSKARDTFVFAEKEALARRFLDLRSETDTAARRAGLLAIQQELSGLRASWPESAHTEDVGRHIARVQKELEALSDQD
ncbi:MAG: hypothetical protein CL927_08395 [Deltaproteobacteria bacterium]|nr:hypothetical protein [Deltaproteobacteria bacterium]HCH63573.1 hypothetical protein [Deltaproteobacteria bacterium]